MEGRSSQPVLSSQAFVAHCALPPRNPMAPHMSLAELDRCIKLSSKGVNPVSIHAKLLATRQHRGQAGPDLTTVRRVLKGQSHKRGRVQARGRPRKLSNMAVLKLNSSRKKLIRTAAGESQVHYKDIMRDARVTHVTRQCVAGNLRNQFGVQWCAPRNEPVRTKEELKERVRIAKKWSHLPNNYFTERVDGIMDNKKFVVPSYPRALTVHKKSRVRGIEQLAMGSSKTETGTRASLFADCPKVQDPS
jgi:hypothetical protein